MSIPAISHQIGYFFLSFFLSAIFTPIVIFFARKTGLISRPRPDRWHKAPTALCGGIAIFLGFTIPMLFLPGHLAKGHLLLLAGGAIFFAIGLVDDLFELSPQGKFLAQLISSVAIVGFGLEITWPNAPVLTICFSVFWLIALSNAINILDNMDGLASGIAIVTALSLAVYGNLFDIDGIIVPSMLLAGSSLGFFMYNFKPARIFMGDCGSLFLGFCLGALAILSTNFASDNSSSGYYGGLSNMILMLSIPMAVLIIPIFDTVFVSITRLQAGRSIAQGGRDHTSHRLVMLGLSEERAVLTLMSASVFISAMSLYMAVHSMDGLLAVLSITAVFALFFGVFLSYLNPDIYTTIARAKEGKSRIGTAITLLLNKKQILQVCIDLILLAVAYYAAYLLKFDGHIDAFNKRLIVKSLPMILSIKLCWMWILGLYRGQWRFASLDDTFKIIKATFFSSLTIVGLLVFLYRFEGYSRVVFFLDAMMTFMLMAGVRFLMRMFNEYFVRQAEKNHSIPILMFGAGDGGDLFLRELRKRKGHDYWPVGFIDDDIAKLGQEIHGVKVLGTRKDIARIIKRYGVKIVFISILSTPLSEFDDFLDRCKRLGVKCVRIRPLVPFEKLNGSEIAEGRVVPFRKRRKKRR